MDAVVSLFTPTSVLVACIAGLVAYEIYKIKTNYLRAQGISGPSRLPFLGTSYRLFTEGLIDHDIAVQKKYGHVVSLFEGGVDALFVSDEDMLREIMVKEFNNFANRQDLGGARADKILKNMLTVLTDAEWKRMRSLLTPVFSTGKLKSITSGINACGELLVENLGLCADSGDPFEAKDYCGAFTLDVIARTGFGILVNSQKDRNNEFVAMSRKVFDFDTMNPFLIIAFLAPSLLKYFMKMGLSFIDKSVSEFFKNVVEQIMETRDTGDKTHQDLIQLMVNAHNSEYDAEEVAKEVAEDGINFESNPTHRTGLSKNEIIAQGFMFFMAGYDTTANGISFLLYNLACNPECQKKVQEEIDQVLGDKTDVSYADVQSMTYLDQCLQESLRLYAPAARVDRVASKDTVIKGIHIRKDTVIVVPIQAIHSDPNIWPEPEKFNPDRFTPEEKAKHTPFHHMPFGYGPRNCIAMRLALMEVKMATALILKKVNLLTCEKTQIPLKLKKFGFLKAEKGIWLKAERR